MLLPVWPHCHVASYQNHSSDLDEWKMVAKNYKIRPKSQAKQSQVKVQNADSSLWSGLFALISVYQKIKMIRRIWRAVTWYSRAVNWLYVGGVLSTLYIFNIFMTQPLLFLPQTMLRHITEKNDVTVILSNHASYLKVSKLRSRHMIPSHQSSQYPVAGLVQLTNWLPERHLSLCLHTLS